MFSGEFFTLGCAARCWQAYILLEAEAFHSYIPWRSTTSDVQPVAVLVAALPNQDSYQSTPPNAMAPCVNPILVVRTGIMHPILQQRKPDSRIEFFSKTPLRSRDAALAQYRIRYFTSRADVHCSLIRHQRTLLVLQQNGQSEALTGFCCSNERLHADPLQYMGI